MRTLILASFFSFGGALAAMADDIIKVQTNKSVAEALDALEEILEEAGGDPEIAVREIDGGAVGGIQAGGLKGIVAVEVGELAAQGLERGAVRRTRETVPGLREPSPA